jgi:hypothetical protein
MKKGPTRGGAGPSADERNDQRPVYIRPAPSTSRKHRPCPPHIKIIRVITADDPFGCPWPPSDGNAVWTVVRRTRGFTLWRSIQIVQLDR